MIGRLLGALGLVTAATNAPATAQAIQPYAGDAAANEIYNLLFCDDLAAFKPKDGTLADWQALLFAASPDADKIAELAANEHAESRIRALAYNWLRAHGQPAPKGIVLGVIVEVPLEQGLDVLTAYADGRVRYINQSGKMVFLEPQGFPDAEELARHIIADATPIAAQIGPWDKPRLSPPTAPNIRITFIVSDGLYFGQGPFKVMQENGLAGPLLQHATQLLVLLTNMPAERPKP